MADQDDTKAAVLACAFLQSGYQKQLLEEPAWAATDTGLEQADIQLLSAAAGGLQRGDVSVEECAHRIGADTWKLR